MAIFNSYVKLPEGTPWELPPAPGKKADQRKEWISRCSGEEYVDHSQPTLTLDAARWWGRWLFQFSMGTRRRNMDQL